MWLSGGPSISHRGHQWRHIECTLNEYAASYPQYDTEAWESIENHTSTLYHRKSSHVIRPCCLCRRQMFVSIYLCLFSKQGHNVSVSQTRFKNQANIAFTNTSAQNQDKSNTLRSWRIWIHSLSGVDASCLGGGGQLHNSPLYHKTNTESPELWRETWRHGGNTERPEAWESNPWSSYCGATVHQTTAPL